MAIPPFLKLKGCVIPINEVKHLCRDYDRFGEYSSCDMCVNIDPDMVMQKKELILCHELVEFIEDVYLLDMEENEKEAIAVTIYELFKTKQLNFD